MTGCGSRADRVIGRRSTANHEDELSKRDSNCGVGGRGEKERERERNCRIECDEASKRMHDNPKVCLDVVLCAVSEGDA